MKILRFVCLALGVVLLIVHGIGLLRPDPLGEAELVAGEVAVPGFHYALRSPDHLLSQLADPPAAFDLDRANSLVFRSLVHSDARRLSFFESWPLWLAGRVYEPLGKTQDPWRVARGGGGLCSEAALVLNALAERSGRQARFLSLHGHVVSEVLMDGGWRVADPDFGVVFPVGLDVLEEERGAELLRAPLETKGYPPATISWYVDVFQSAENNRVSQPGVPLSPRLALAERLASWLQWLVPLGLLLVALIGWPPGATANRVPGTSPELPQTECQALRRQALRRQVLRGKAPAKANRNDHPPPSQLEKGAVRFEAVGAELSRPLVADAAVILVAITVTAALLAAEGGAVEGVVADSGAPCRVAVAGHPAAVLAGGRTGAVRRATVDGTSVDAEVGSGTARQIDLGGIVEDLLEAAGKAEWLGC